MSNNTIHVIESLSADIEFDPSFFMEEVVKSARKTAAERDMFVNRDDVRYVGETDAPEVYAGVEGVKFYLFEAEATTRE